MPYSLPLLIANDHAGFPLKTFLKEHRPSLNWKDLGSWDDQRTDYPDWASKLCQHLQPQMMGVLICGTGQGMSMKANQYPFVRAALCWDKNIAQLARAHNNANVLCLPGRFISYQKSLEILDVFLHTSFDNNDVYQRRVSKTKGTS